MVPEAEAFLVIRGLVHHFPNRDQEIRYAVRIAVDRCFLKASLIRGSCKNQTAHGYGSYGDERMSGNAIERGA